MIPSLAIVSVQPERGRPIRLWLPVILVWLLLAPFALILAPFALIAAVVCRFNPIAAIVAVWRILWALGGVRVEVESPRAHIFIRMI